MATDPEYLSPDVEDDAPETVEATPSALAVINQSEHAAMVTTANIERNRRNVDAFSRKLMLYATHSQPVALSMFYSLPRAGKQIVGPSVRYAEIVAPCWKNNSTGSRIVGITDESVTAQGVFIDYEANIRNVKEIPRRITDSKGGKFNSDMILTTSKAALSIAYREAILKGGVPQALWTPAYEEAKLTAVGKAMSHSARIDAAMEYLTKLGVTEWQIMNAVGCTSPKEMETEHLVTLKVMCEEIKRGDRTIEAVFGSQYDKEIEALFTQLKKNEAEKRLLKGSYMGRAKELVEYLRERVTPAARGTEVKQETEKTADTTEAKTDEGTKDKDAAPATGKKSGGKKGKDQTPATDTEATKETTETKPEEKPAASGKEADSGSFNF
jgi:hypothetical protein